MRAFQKILNVRQIREADMFTIQEEGISSVDLMERAATTCVHWIIKHIKNANRFAVICGTGNNGGDGLAIARLLAQQSKIGSIDVFILRYSEKCSADFTENYHRLQACEGVTIHEMLPSSPFRMEKPVDALIDAIIGSGLSAPVTGWLKNTIDAINALSVPVIAIDIPSGLPADSLPSPDTTAIKAAHVLSFQFPKLSFMFPETGNFVEEFHVLSIGLDERYIRDTTSDYYFITKAGLASIVKKRKKFAHKGDFGHALLFAGSYGKMGAAVLASKACLRSGVGLLTTHTPAKGVEVLQTAFPEAMVNVDPHEKIISELPEDLISYDAIGIGPGIGTDALTQEALHQLLVRTKKPLVIDADALNILSENTDWLKLIPEDTILTPHVKEFERLAGSSFNNSFDRLEAARSFAIQHHLIVVLKGAHTAVCTPIGEVYFNSSGNPGMATAGSGDVLTGIITALLSQRYSPLEAALLGVFMHGQAGDQAAFSKGENALIASDIIDAIV